MSNISKNHFVILSNDVVFWVSLPLSLPLCYRISKEIKAMRMIYLLKIQKIHDIKFVNLIFLYLHLLLIEHLLSFLEYWLVFSLESSLDSIFSRCQTLNDRGVLFMRSHKTHAFTSKLSNSIVILIYFIVTLGQWANSALTISFY